MIESLNKWLEHWEPIWLFLILHVEAFIGYLSLVWLIKEYQYDENKDLKKQKRTKTRKTTTQPGGASVVEETEILEQTGDSNEDKKA